MTIASLVLGIIAVSLCGVCFCVPIFGQITPVLLGGLAIIFGGLGLKKQPAKANMAKAGLVLGIIGVVIPLLVIVAYLLLGVNPSVKKPFDWKLLKPKNI